MFPVNTLCTGPRYCGNLYSIFGPAGARKYLATFPVPNYREHFQQDMHQDVVGDRLHPDMHAFLRFHFLQVPILPHLCNWYVSFSLATPQHISNNSHLVAS